MKAIVHDGSGSPDGLHLREIDKPIVTDDLVRVRVRAASVNALDWHTLHGGRLVKLIAFLLRSATSDIPGVDMALRTRMVGRELDRRTP